MTETKPIKSVASHTRTPGPDTAQRHDILLSPRCYWKFEQQSKLVAPIVWFAFMALLLYVIKRYLSLQKFKMPEFKNAASLNGL